MLYYCNDSVMGSCSEIMDDSGFPVDTRQSSKVTGNICIDVKGRWTVTGACVPYNLGGSATNTKL